MQSLKIKMGNHRLKLKNRKFILTFCIVILIFAFYIFNFGEASAAVLTKPPTNLGLVGYWSMNENTGTIATDFSGNGNRGILTGGPTWVDGKRGKALDFDGSDDFVSIPNALNFSTMSVSAWVNADQNSVNTAGRVFAQNRTNDFVLAVDNGGTASPYAVLVGITTSIDRRTAANIIKPNSWNHIVGTYNGSGASSGINIYVNGVSQSLVDAVNFGLGDAQTTIGASIVSGLPTRLFDGLIDEVRVYNRALSAAEIQALYKSGASRQTQGPSNPGLVGYWPMNENTGTVASDFSGNGNRGILTGGPTWVDGKRGNALNFDGVNDYVNLGSPASLNGTGSHTISLWANLNNIGAAGNYDIFFEKNSDCGAGAGWGMVVYYSTPSTWAAAVVTTSGGAVNYAAESTSPTPTPGTWVHLVGVYDNSSQTITLYTDGISRQTTNTGNTLRVGDDSTIGVQRPNTCTFIDLANAKIDEARVSK